MIEYNMLTRNNHKFKRLLDGGEPSVAMRVNPPWLAIPETIGSVGCAAALTHMERTTDAVRDIQNVIVACTAAGITPFYRPTSTHSSDVACEFGADTERSIFPPIATRAQIQHAVASTRWPTLGVTPRDGTHARQDALCSTQDVDLAGVSALGVTSTPQATVIEAGPRVRVDPPHPIIELPRPCTGVARQYASLGKQNRTGRITAPSVEHAMVAHELLDAVQEPSRTTGYRYVLHLPARSDGTRA